MIVWKKKSSQVGVGLKSLEIRGSETDSEAPLVKLSLVYKLQ